MKLNELHDNPGATKPRKRVGRGPGSGTGKTSGRGMKGQKARNNVIPQFEGGQMPIHRRVPKRGFVNIHRVEVHGINLSRIEGAFADGETADIEAIRAKGLVPKKATIIKLLGSGEITKKVTVKVHRASKSAQAKLEAAGGTLELVPEKTPKAEG